MVVSESFRADFDLVCETYHCPPDEIEIMRELVRADYPSAIEAFTGTARTIREIAASDVPVDRRDEGKSAG